MGNKDFKDAEIGSQWELNDGSRMVVVDRDIFNHNFFGCVPTDNGEHEVLFFESNGKCTDKPSKNVKAPWREKLKWEGEVKWELSIAGPYPFMDSPGIEKFIGKKTRMTLEEL